jgi:uncharacterized membrane protein/thiol-disulfide isomerase/thioredoxin
MPPVLVPGRGGPAYRGPASASQPVFSTPVCWTLRVLAWLAFAVASYLAWHAIQQTAVAGCTVGSNSGCDAVLTSSWSKWLGIPVSVVGLAGYATLATLSILLGAGDATMNKWITTAFVMLSVVAAGASLWFLGIQAFALHTFCMYCVPVDICGLLLGAIAAAFAIRNALAARSRPQPRTMQPGLMALRTAMPGSSRAAPVVVTAAAATPSLIPAFGGAIPFIVILIGGQLLFAAKTYELQKGELTKSIQLDGAQRGTVADNDAKGETHVAMRPTDAESNLKPSLTDIPKNDAAKDGVDKTAARKSTPSATSPDAGPSKERIVKFLGGKLSLDVYKNPIIGNPEAPHIAIEMVSYDCPHCRKMYPMLQHALDRYGDQVAILVMMSPLDSDCNKLVTDPAASHQGACEIAKLALGIAKVNPAAFATFHDFLMADKDKPPTVQSALPRAYLIADRDQVRAFTHSTEADKQIEGYVDLYAELQKMNSSNKNFGLPIQILGDYVMSGSVEHEEDLFKAWEEHLGVKPK